MKDMMPIRKNIAYKVAICLVVIFSIVLCSTDDHGDHFYKKYYLTKAGNRMIEAIYHRRDNKQDLIDCYAYGDSKVIKTVLKNVSNSSTVFVNNTQLSKIINFCHKSKLKGHFDTESHEFYKHFYGIFSGLFIFPGTKWCGAGDIADNYDDLGPEIEADICCRTHDHCNDSIEAFGTKHGLKNKAPVTKSHCDCDKQFQNCLNEADTKTSHRLGRIFFNYLCLECFRKDYPIISCAEYRGRFPFRNCQEYELDESQDPVWQFFDNKRYEPNQESEANEEDKAEELKWLQHYKKTKLKNVGTVVTPDTAFINMEINLWS